MTGLKYLVLLLLKWVVLFSKKIHLLPCWDYLYPLNRIGPLILSVLLKLPPRKLKLWIILWSFFLLRLLFISWIYHTVLYWMAPSCYLGRLDKLQKRICRTVRLCCFSSTLVTAALVILIGWTIFLSPFIDLIKMSMLTVYFLAQLDSRILCVQSAFLWTMI